MLARLTLEVESEFEHLDAALEAADFTEVAAATHNIRGTAQLVGATRLVDACARVERAATRAAHAPAADLAALRHAWELTRRAIEAQMEGDRREYHPSSRG
jgi:HPt (histidine-containing phosphotransfer) domain-containing protein